MLEIVQRTYFSPDDPCEAVLLAFVQTAKTGVRVADYSFNLTQLVDILINQHAAGIDVQLVLDRSQAAGKSERPIVAELRAAGVPLVVGTSDKHRIMHQKFLVIDGVSVLSGSYNFTHTASLESNYFDIIQNPLRAEAFTAAWQRIWDFISANEPQERPAKPPPGPDAPLYKPPAS